MLFFFFFLHAKGQARVAHHWLVCITATRVSLLSTCAGHCLSHAFCYCFSMWARLSSPAAVIPLFLVVMFEVAYAVHKRRSVKFCGIVFDVRWDGMRREHI